LILKLSDDSAFQEDLEWMLKVISPLTTSQKKQVKKWDRSVFRDKLFLYFQLNLRN